MLQLNLKQAQLDTLFTLNKDSLAPGVFASTSSFDRIFASTGLGAAEPDANALDALEAYLEATERR